MPIRASYSQCLILISGRSRPNVHLPHRRSLDFGIRHPCDPRESSVITLVRYGDRVESRLLEAVQGDDRGGGRELSMVVFETRVGNERPASPYGLRRDSFRSNLV
jgi:hypothetical protein